MKAALPTILKRMGIFHLSRLLFRNDFLIPCYHGFAVRDEHVFDPGLFQSPKMFIWRMDLLKWLNCPVIPLGRAIDGLCARPAENGGGVFHVGADHPDGAIAKSATRKKLFDEGKYQPKSCSIIWPREKLIAWAERG